MLPQPLPIPNKLGWCKFCWHIETELSIEEDDIQGFSNFLENKINKNLHGHLLSEFSPENIESWLPKIHVHSDGPQTLDVEMVYQIPIKQVHSHAWLIAACVLIFEIEHKLSITKLQGYPKDVWLNTRPWFFHKSQF